MKLDLGRGGFSEDLGGLYSGGTGAATNILQPYREAAIRALVDVGTTRVWNLMIDMVAQTGRFPQGAKALHEFNVSGERRYWLHIAIDRSTGRVLDQQLERVDAE